MTRAEELDPILLSRAKAAFLLGVSIRSVDYLISKNELPARRIGRRVLVPYSSLLAWARRDHPESFGPEKDSESVESMPARGASDRTGSVR